MANQLNLLFYCVFVTLVIVSNGFEKVFNRVESRRNIINSSKLQDDHSNALVEDVMWMDSPECDCGEFGVSCHFNEDGRQNCTCVKGYGPKYLNVTTGKQICEKCDCGPNGIECRLFPQGKKYCRCQLGKYIDFFITKTDRKCKECQCGPNSKSCDFNSEKNRICKCVEGYSSERESEDIADEYCKKCDCGAHGVCKVTVVEDRSNKECICESGYVEVDGKCKRCDCGLNSVNCSFYRYNGNRQCDCKKGYVSKESYVFKDEYCERCDCGEFGVDCTFLFGYRRCTCQEGYFPTDSGDRNDFCEKNFWRSGGMIAVIVIAVAAFIVAAAFVIIRLISRRNR